MTAFPWPWLPVETDSREVQVLAEKVQQNLEAIIVDPQGAPDATTLVKGLVRLAGDLAGTAGSPTVPGLAAKQDLSEKAVANGYASLDSGGHVPAGQIPASSFTRAFLLMGA